jgi:hypothetical protein
MRFEAGLTEEDIAILQQAAQRALEIAAQRGLLVEPDGLVGHLCDAYFRGERGVQQLAHSAFTESLTLH